MCWGAQQVRLHSCVAVSVCISVFGTAIGRVMSVFFDILKLENTDLTTYKDKNYFQKVLRCFVVRRLSEAHL